MTQVSNQKTMVLSEFSQSRQYSTYTSLLFGYFQLLGVFFCAYFKIIGMNIHRADPMILCLYTFGLCILTIACL